MSSTPTAQPAAIDAFCGAGGLSLGLNQAGFDVVFAFDTNTNAIRTYCRNLGSHAAVDDVRNVSGQTVRGRSDSASEVRLVAGGPPCQGFSVQRRNGEFDPRNSLPMEFLRLVRELTPTYFLFENVPGIQARHGQRVLEELIEDASSLGYVCHSRVIDAVNYGVPQRRKRLFIVGEHAPDGRCWFDFPPKVSSENSPTVTVAHALRGLPTPPDDYTEHPEVPNHRRTRLSELNMQRLVLVPPGGGMEDLPPELRVPCHQNGADKIGHRYVYGRLHPDRPSCTITARFDSFTRGQFAHPVENRNISLREGARLQSFPDDFVFEGGQEEIAAQIGNAVPPQLARALGLAIKHAIDRREQGDDPIRTDAQHTQSLLFQ